MIKFELSLIAFNTTFIHLTNKVTKNNINPSSEKFLNKFYDSIG